MQNNKINLHRSNKTDNDLVRSDTENKISAMPYDEDECRVFVATMIKRERIKRDLSVYELSKRSGVHINHITRIEKGKFSPRICTIIKLLAAMNLELKVL